jgi:hypothetical protein
MPALVLVANSCLAGYLCAGKIVFRAYRLNVDRWVQQFMADRDLGCDLLIA